VGVGAARWASISARDPGGPRLCRARMRWRRASGCCYVHVEHVGVIDGKSEFATGRRGIFNAASAGVVMAAKWGESEFCCWPRERYRSRPKADLGKALIPSLLAMDHQTEDQ